MIWGYPYFRKPPYRWPPATQNSNPQNEGIIRSCTPEPPKHSAARTNPDPWLTWSILVIWRLTQMSSLSSCFMFQENHLHVAALYRMDHFNSHCRCYCSDADKMVPPSKIPLFSAVELHKPGRSPSSPPRKYVVLQSCCIPKKNLYLEYPHVWCVYLL